MSGNNYTYEVNNIKIENIECNLCATFDVIETDEDGNEISISTHEWIDLENGYVDDEAANSNLHYNHREVFEDFYGEYDIEDIFGEIDSWLEVNPISEETLEECRIAKAEREEEIFSHRSA